MNKQLAYLNIILNEFLSDKNYSRFNISNPCPPSLGLKITKSTPRNYAEQGFFNNTKELTELLSQIIKLYA
jgi:hypothetical protein